MEIFKWMRESFGFNLFMFILTCFNTYSRIATGTMIWPIFILNAIVLYIFLSNIIRIRAAKQEEPKDKDEHP